MNLDLIWFKLAVADWSLESFSESAGLRVAVAMGMEAQRKTMIERVDSRDFRVCFETNEVTRIRRVIVKL